MLTYQGRNSWMAVELLRERMWVDINDYHALQSCVQNGAVDVAKLLLDGGIDFGRYRQIYPNSGSPEVIQALEEHWAELQAQVQEQDEGQAPAESGAPIEAQPLGGEAAPGLSGPEARPRRSGFDGKRSPSEMSEPCPQEGVSDMALGAAMGGMTLG